MSMNTNSSSSSDDDPFKDLRLSDSPPTIQHQHAAQAPRSSADVGTAGAAAADADHSLAASASPPSPPLSAMSSLLSAYQQQPSEPPTRGEENHLGGSTTPATDAVVPPVGAAAALSSLAMPPATGKRRARARVAPAVAPRAAERLPPATTSATATSKRQAKQQAPPTEQEALELRRKYNRESMQRTRAREREEVEGMRTVLAELELEYKRAVSLQAQRVRDPLRMQYHALSAATKQLMQENFSMRQDLEYRRKCYERVERILADYHAEKADIAMMDTAAPAEQEAGADSTSAALDIPLITEAEAFALIAKCSQQTIESLERHACTSPTTPPLRSDAPFFGWDVRRRIDDAISSSSVHFLFTKVFPNLSAPRTANSAWEVYSSLDRNNVKPIRVVRFETLQVVNENTHVIARDVIHPRHEGAVLRSIFLRFRMETEKGFVIGRSCMNPVSARCWREENGDCDSSDANNISISATNALRGMRYTDLSTWLEVNYLDPSRRDEVGCEVRFGGITDYGTTHDLNARFMDVLFSVLQMENRVLEPLESLPK